MAEGENVCVIGLWHLGAVVSACLADLGYRVSAYDENDKIVKSLQNGKAVVEEPGLDDLITENLHSSKLFFFSSLEDALKNCKFVLITTDTPLDEEDNVDLSGVFRTTKEIAKLAANDLVLIVQSQVPVGTCTAILKQMKEINPSRKFEIAYSPENLRLGNAISIFKNPDRIIIGSEDLGTLDKIENFYSVIGAPVIKMDVKSAEMSKHAINAFLANCISFINEIGNLCEEIGADALMVSKSLTTESRIGNKLPLKPGLGFAGGTLARDLKILKKLNVEHGLNPNLINAIIQTNYEQNIIALKKLKKHFGNLSGLKIGILGLTYKAGTNTLRRSSSITIISQLLDENVTITVYDPVVDNVAMFEKAKFKIAKNEYEVAEDTDALVLLTDWPQFKKIDFNKIYNVMKKPIFLDMKNFLDPENMRKIGFTYISVGRG
jgi:UDPglucose 6-dehydrogenase